MEIVSLFVEQVQPSAQNPFQENEKMRSNQNLRKRRKQNFPYETSALFG